MIQPLLTVVESCEAETGLDVGVGDTTPAGGDASTAFVGIGDDKRCAGVGVVESCCCCWR